MFGFLKIEPPLAQPVPVIDPEPVQPAGAEQNHVPAPTSSDTPAPSSPTVNAKAAAERRGDVAAGNKQDRADDSAELGKSFGRGIRA
jgi:hypothetical protein